MMKRYEDRKAGRCNVEAMHGVEACRMPLMLHQTPFPRVDRVGVTDTIAGGSANLPRTHLVFY